MRGCCRAPATKSFKEGGAAGAAAREAAQPLGGVSADDDVLLLLPDGGTKAQLPALKAALLPLQGQEEHGDWISAAYCQQSGPDDIALEAAVAQALGLPAPMGEPPAPDDNNNSNTASAADSTQHTLQRQVEQMLASLEAAPPRERAWPPQQEAAAFGPPPASPAECLSEMPPWAASHLPRCASNGSSNDSGHHSPRRCSSSLSWEAVATKRYSASGSVPPVLVTIPESSSQSQLSTGATLEELETADLAAGTRPWEEAFDWEAADFGTPPGEAADAPSQAGHGAWEQAGGQPSPLPGFLARDDGVERPSLFMLADIRALLGGDSSADADAGAGCNSTLPAAPGASGSMLCSTYGAAAAAAPPANACTADLALSSTDDLEAAIAELMQPGSRADGAGAGTAPAAGVTQGGATASAPMRVAQLAQPAPAMAGLLAALGGGETTHQVYPHQPAQSQGWRQISHGSSGRSISEDGTASYQSEASQALPPATHETAANHMPAATNGGSTQQAWHNSQGSVPSQATRTVMPAPHAPGWGSEGSDAEDDGGPLAAMYARQVRERQEAELRYAEMRQQQDQKVLAACTFKPARATAAAAGWGNARPGSAPAAGPGSSPVFGEEAAIELYERQIRQRQRAQERSECQRQQLEQEALAQCTFHPAVAPRSQALCEAGVRYGGGATLVRCARPASPVGEGMEEAVRRQLELLHRAGLNSSAAAAVLSHSMSGLGGGGGGARAAAQVQREGSAAGGKDGQARAAACLAGTAAAELEPQSAAAATDAAGQPAAGDSSQPASQGTLGQGLAELAGAGLPHARTPPASPSRRQSAPAPGGGTGFVRLCTSPVKASDRLYAHARDMQQRQHQAGMQREQKLRQEALAASPKARPFPRSQHSSAPSPPLSRRSPRPSRPASAARAQLDSVLGGAAAQLAPQAQQEERQAAYWQRFGLAPRSDFGGFLHRQQRIAAGLEAKLERERQRCVPAQQGATLSPGSRLILQRRQRSQAQPSAGAQPGIAFEAGGAGNAGQTHEASRQRPLSASHAVRAALARGISGMLGLAGMPAGAEGAQGGGQGGEAGAFDVASLAAWGDSEGMCTAGSDSLAAPGGDSRGRPATQPHLAHCTFHPTITERAAALPGRSPEQLHAEWAARQAKMDLKRRLHEEAAVAACTFRPDISPAAGAGSKYGAARPRINMQDLGGHSEELQRRREAKEAACVVAAQQREEREAAECTFQPNLQPPLAGRARPAKAPPARLPSVLEQVQALLAGRRSTDESGGTGAAVAPLQAAAATGLERVPGRMQFDAHGKPVVWLPAAGVFWDATLIEDLIEGPVDPSVRAERPAAMPAAPRRGAATGFDAYLARVAREMESLRPAD